MTIPTPTPEDFFWLALTVYYEAVGEPRNGQKAVVKVVMNRAVRGRKTVKEIVLAPWQFSCWNGGIDGPPGNPLRTRLLARVFETVMEGYQEWINGARLRGATHFYAPKAMVPPGRVPSWVPSMTFIAEFAGHRFYREGEGW